jgi:hypothetical protein
MEFNIPSLFLRGFTDGKRFDTISGYVERKTVDMYTWESRFLALLQG